MYKIDTLQDNCPHNLNFPHHNLYCHYDVNNQENILCKSCREIIDINCNKSIFFKYMSYMQKLL